MSYRTTNRDKSHLAIVAELRKRGLSVLDLAMVGHSVPDILVADRTQAVLVELKEPNGVFYLHQLEFLAQWKGNAMFAQTADEICLAMASGAFLSDSDKGKVLSVVIRQKARSKDKNPRITVSKFEKEMYG